MKKLFAMGLSVILVLAMTACGNGNSDNVSSGNGNSDELSGSYLDEDTGTMLLTFAGNNVTLNLLSNGSVYDGTYEAADGYMIFRFAESTRMPAEPTPYTVDDAELIIDGTTYIRQSGGVPGEDGESGKESGGEVSNENGVGAGGGDSSDGNAPNNGTGDELNGNTFIEETGSVSLTFVDGKVILDFPTENYSAEGIFEAADGYLTFHFDEYTPMGDRPVPYEMQDGNLILDGTPYIRQ